MAKLPPRFAKGASQLSLNTKQKIRARPQEYAYSAAASFQEITRLISLNDEQKLYIQKLHSDMKTLKIVNTRQERALQSLDKDQMEFPKVFQTMSEELRIARSERQKALEKVLQLEKQAVAKAEDFHKLGQRLKDTKDKLKVMMNPDVEALNAELSLKTKELESSRVKIEPLALPLLQWTRIGWFSRSSTISSTLCISP
ncbi:hypothetical protein HDU91_003452 [Kappamyces sp. JEL0680]|nr:hypothetical protein HDU91_003452 [Kappamyces sp. JEL0680]